ncbi:GNAT family N-acetyltransferase [Dyella acidisoli]|uniref:N-acetyltransferase n=1 Tax=Dyella acidisoli TaxID=1867834 RepID=A0ABQ5XU05_9GAMM|nr:GNAT family N-acetyltransferase [Dyella acidisoli]GLQ95185.1 N-acetyltransferase [Dyella acidisoli]
MSIHDIRIIETERLILRPPIREDFDAYAANMADAEAAHFIGGMQSRPVAWRGFLTLAGAWMIQGYSMFSVIEKATGHWVGRLGPWQPEGWPGKEVGWGLARGAWGKGYAYEGAVAAIDWSFEHLGWTDIIHSINSDNLPSIALAKRLGSRFLRHSRLPEPYQDVTVEVWGQTREEWLLKRGMR